MKLILYNNFSETNQVNKTISKVIELEGSLLDSTSIINPIIKIFFNPESMNGYVVDDNQIYVTFNGLKITWDTFIYNYVLAANYAYIPEFNRYYFINDIISIRKNIWQLVMNVDVLMSYKDVLLKLDAFIVRNEYEYDDMVKDDLISYYYDKEVTEYIPQKGNKVNTTFDTYTTHSRNCVLSCITFVEGSLSSADSDINPPSGTTLPKIKQNEYGEKFSETCFVMPMNKVNTISYRVLESDNLGSFVKSIVVYPFDLEAESNEQYIVYLGRTAIVDLDTQDTEYLYAYHAKYKVSNYYVIADFTISGNKFLDYEPFTMYELFIPYYGWLTLSTNQIMNHRLIVYYTIKVEDGSANVYVYDTTANKTLFTSTCQLGIRIGLSTTNNEEISASKKANNLNLTLGLISSLASIGIGAYTGNATAVVGGVLSGAKSVTSFINNNSTMFDKAQSTFSDSVSGMYSSQDVKVRKTKMKPKNYNADYAKLFGKPLNEYRKLSTLHGFTTVGNIHIENIASATRNEHDQLKALLEEGIIL